MTRKNPYNETRYKNNRAYDKKTYKFISVRLRLSDDEDIISALNEDIKDGYTYRDVFRTWYEHRNAKTADNGGHTIESDVLPILDSLTGVKPENKDRAAEIAEKVQSDLRYKNIVRELTESEV